MEQDQQKLSGFELEDGEVCDFCGCLAGDHDLNGCPNHPRCANFYRYHDFEFLAD
jgi:hypothetical protein